MTLEEIRDKVAVLLGDGRRVRRPYGYFGVVLHDGGHSEGRIVAKASYLQTLLCHADESVAVVKTYDVVDTGLGIILDMTGETRRPLPMSGDVPGVDWSFYEQTPADPD